MPSEAARAPYGLCSYAGVRDAAALARRDAGIDVALAGRTLAAPGPTRLAAAGAHDPTPTPYIVLDELLGPLGLGPGDHLLDVGCGLGRVLAWACARKLACRVTGVELDAGLARAARAWTERVMRVRPAGGGACAVRPAASSVPGRELRSAACPSLNVLAGNVLAIPLVGYTHIYLFNPFDTAVLVRFLDRLERATTGPVTVVHMSDNGEELAYLGRPGWSVVRTGEIWDVRLTPGAPSVRVFGCPQHYTQRLYTP